MKITYIPRMVLAALLVVGAAIPAAAQGKSKAAEKKNEKAKETKVITTTSGGEVIVTKADKNDKAKHATKGPKKVTTSQAVIVTRDVLIANGYQVVQVVPSGATQIIYYRRGNRGNGRGLGPVEKMIVIPAGSVVQFQSVPQPLLSTILRRLGM